GRTGRGGRARSNKCAADRRRWRSGSSAIKMASMASVDVTVETEIAAAPADVAAVMFDPQREPEWMSAIKKVDILDAALQAGARVTHTASFMGRDLSWTTEVESVHFPHVLRLK